MNSESESPERLFSNTAAICLNCSQALRDPEEQACPSCQTSLFSPSMLSATYPLPSLQAYELEELAESKEALHRYTYQLWRAVKLDQDCTGAAQDFLDSNPPAGWIAGLIHRARMEDDERTAELFSALRFLLLVREENSSEPTGAPPTIPENAWESDDLLGVLAAGVLNKQITSLTAARQIEARLDPSVIGSFVNRTLSDAGTTRTDLKFNLFRHFIALLLCERFRSPRGVMTSAFNASLPAYQLGLHETAFSLLRVAYVMAAESGDVDSAVHALRNMLTVSAERADVKYIEGFLEIYNGPPWTEGREVMAGCADCLTHLIARCPPDRIDNRSLAQLLLPHVSELFFHHASYLSLEEYVVRGLYPEAERLLGVMAELAEEMDSREGRSLTWFYSGNMEKARGQYTRACEFFKKAFEVEQYTDPQKAFTVLNALTRTEIEMGLTESARQHHIQCLRLAGSTPPAGIRANSLATGGMVEMAEGRYEDAVMLFQQAQELFDALPPEEWRLLAQSNRNNLAKCLAALGREPSGQPHGTQEVQSLLSEGHMLLAKGHAEAELEKSARLFEAAAERFRKMDHRQEESIALYNAGVAWIKKKEWGSAAQLLEQALALCEKHGYRHDLPKDKLEATLHLARLAVELTPFAAPSGAYDAEATGEVFKYLGQKAMVGTLTDGELSDLVADPTLAGSLVASFAVNVPFAADKRRARLYADLALRVLRLSGLQEPLLQKAVGMALVEVGRNDDARELLARSVPKELTGDLDEKLSTVRLLLTNLESADNIELADSIAREALASRDPGLSIQGHELAARVARARGDVQNAIRSYESAWALASAATGENASGGFAAACALADLHLHHMENPSAAAAWLARAREVAPDYPFRRLDFIEAGIDMLGGRLLEAEEKFRSYKSACDDEGDTENSLDAEVNIVTIAVARQTLRGERARKQIGDLRRRCEEAGMAKASINCTKLLGDLATLEGCEEEALEAYGQLSGRAEGEIPPSLLATLRVMRIQAVAEPSERLAELLLAIDDWAEEPSVLRYQLKLLVMAAEMLTAGVEPAPRAARALRGLAPPVPPFTAAFECCRRAENIAVDLSLDFELPNIIFLMGLSLAQAMGRDSIFSISGFMLKARQLAEEQLARAVDAKARSDWRAFIGKTEAWALSFADFEGQSENVFAVFETIHDRDQQSQTRRGWQSLEAGGNNPEVIKLEALAAEMESLARLIGLGSDAFGDLIDRYSGLLQEYHALWAGVEQEMGQSPLSSAQRESPAEPLPSGLALVEIIAALDHTFVLVTTREGRTHFRLEWSLNLIKSWKDSLLSGLLEYTVGPWLFECGRTLWQNIEQACGSAEVLCVSTNDPLRGVPLHAALAHASGRPVFYVASKDNLLTQLDAAPRLRRLVSFIDPEGDLPGSHLEAAGLGPLFPDSVINPGAAADWETFMRLAPSAEVLHLACHGEYVHSDPIRSGLRLARGTRIEGPKLAFQVKLSAHLVLLSACYSGTSAEVEEGSAIPWLFLKAGARCVLGVLWQLPDVAAAILLPHFCSLILNGERPATALRKAALQLSEMRIGQVEESVKGAQLSEEVRAQLLNDLALYTLERPFADPYYWGGFIIIGDGWTRGGR